ncbi:granulin a [Clarias gariepinus]|uniref:granulin a n=1 Tax=Clarias gariepinus TaxID=13013 RepID=UPI00234D030D|nr:granulin a [Clarias gariepinus]
MTRLKMLRLTAGVLLLSLVAGSRCPDQQRCGDEQTCCQIQSGEFNCCPFHQAECCEDHLHCCPEGMLCEVKESRCTNATHSLPWAERFPSGNSNLDKSFRMISSSDANNMYDTICPDNSFCPADFSCLKVSNTYGCCPLAQGIVCSDGKHCCPNDRECTADSTSCVKKTEPVLAVVCADGMSECPVETSCCETADGGWGCCPMPRAVCCDDKVHCCPEDSVCDVKSAKCLSSTNQEFPMWAKFPARQRAAWEDHTYSEVPCDDTMTCPEGNTCCKDGKGGWGCCPLLQAVCCEDHVHCCPNGKKCNLAAQTCEDPSGSVPWLKKEPSRPIRGQGSQKVPETEGSDVPCDDTVACPDETTCCKNEEGGWGCCPMPKAVCCEDHVHCCPNGKKCNLAAQTCEDPSGSVPWLKKEPSRPIRGQKVPETKGSDVPCDDTVACPDETTCCKNEEGGWGCCPMPKAVCCEDHVHCCPNGKKCNLAAQTCEDPSGSVPWLKKEPSRPIRGRKVLETKGSDVPCDDTVACPDETTCCKNEEGGWGCCPMPKAVCCEDHVHCCPNGKKCNLAAQTCEDLSGSVPWLKKEPSRPIRGQKVPETKGSDVPCDDTVACPDETTCCKNEEGGWGCCPMPQAVCCEDHVHCCPNGKKCNLAAQTCEDPSGSVPWLKKEPSRPIRGQKVPETKGSDVPCDDTVACPDETTCCKNEEGGWGCCPMPKAVCCEDHVHCCPNGKKCNLAAQTCEDPSGSVPWLKKEPSRPIRGQKVPETKGSDVPCDDTVACPDETTCCKNEEGGWGCCPMPKAVCCEDHVHCCPNGKKCNLAAQTCEDPSGSVPWLKKEPSRPIRGQKVPETKGSDVPCDDTVACPDETTCCKNEEGGWGCCPMPKAVCCEDHVHCCPNGKKCNLAAQTCEDPSGSVPWLKKEPSRPIRGQKVPETKGSDVPCDDTVACADETTCCKNEEGGWGCCPMPKAVCCEDHVHCCPNGKKCNLAAQTCEDLSGSVPWLKKEPSQPIRGQKVPETKGSDVPCDDTVACPDETTCCKNEEGGWGCCPMPQAVCCEDHVHCCPNGKKCNLAAQTCEDPSGSVPWLKKEPSRPIRGQKVPETKGSDVPCDDTVACPDETTCCKNEEGGWGCCPMPKAVCCEDHVHCCPNGKKCNLAAQTCEDPSGSVPWLKTESSRPIRGQKVPETKGSDVPCDDTVACPDETTCCKNEEGGWGCCPMPQAVCCEDHIHCCPDGKKCNLAAQTCEDPSGSVPWLMKEPSRPIKGRKIPETEGSDVPCDDTVACPDETTCCKNEEGGWGCCPMPQAVCCEDHIHCCPNGKKCNLAAQTCEDPSGSVPWLKKEPSRPIKGRKISETKVSDVPCDDTVACPDETTCCKNEEGGWGCCPMPQAVCCEDHVHCCPNGKKCNLAAQTCEDLSGSVPWLKKEPSRPIRGRMVPETKGSDVPCDDTVACPDETTCCKNEEGGWGCCPMPQAVCCEDHVHCCPNGKKCNLAAQTCEDASGSVPWLKKEPSRPIRGQKVPETKGSDVPCDDTVACPDETTCCKNEEGGWGCCPMPKAVCCEDHVHCCPNGKKCNLAAQTCEDSLGSVPWLKKEPSRPIRGWKVPKDFLFAVPCNDTVACDDGKTCCKNQQGEWSCCPLPQAVCCEDFVHCCPHGKQCNLASRSCDKPSESVPWWKKEPSHPTSDKSVPKTKGSDVPCDDTMSCPDGNTCCKTEQGEWACCPMPQAVCCEDFLHCCPHGKKCNLAAQSCDDLAGSVPWMKKEPSQPTASTARNTSVNVVVQCDTKTSCPDHTTCCLMDKSKKYGCCPLDHATCCPGGENCCPRGYNCREEWCVKTSWNKFESVALVSVMDTAIPQAQTDIGCGDGFTCNDSETCCRTSESSWGCCPYQKAVCCSDMQHCCPSGYTCDQSGSCTAEMGFNWDVLFSRKKRAPAV